MYFPVRVRLLCQGKGFGCRCRFVRELGCRAWPAPPRSTGWAIRPAPGSRNGGFVCSRINWLAHPIRRYNRPNFRRPTELSHLEGVLAVAVSPDSDKIQDTLKITSVFGRPGEGNRSRGSLERGVFGWLCIWLQELTGAGKLID
jgi:hypothetical protein